MVPFYKDLGKSPQKESVVGRTFQKKTCLKPLSHTFLKIGLLNIYEYRGGSQSSPTNTGLRWIHYPPAAPAPPPPLWRHWFAGSRTPLPTSGLVRTPDESTRAQMDGLRPSDAERSAAASSGDWFSEAILVSSSPLISYLSPRRPPDAHLRWKKPQTRSHVIALWTHGAGPFQSHPRRNECPRTLPSPVAAIYPLAESFRALRWKMKWTCGDGGISLMRKHVEKSIEAAGPHLATVKLFHP